MKKTTIAIVVLLLALLVGSFYFMNQNSLILQENNALKQGLDSLQHLKLELQEEMDSLQNTFSAMIQEKDSVNRSLETAMQNLIEEQNRKLRKMRGNPARDIQRLKEEVSQLEHIRDDMQTIIEQLKQEEQALTAANTTLTGQLDSMAQANETLTSEVTELREINAALSEELKLRRAKALQASNFLIKSLTKRAQAPADNRDAPTIAVEFDLHDVPAEWQGAHRLYVVIRDANSLPIPSSNPIKAVIHAPEERVELLAQQSKEVTLGPSQRLEIRHELSEKLKPGTYRATVYFEKGLLGAAFFTLK